MFPEKKQVLERIAKGIRGAQEDYTKACESLISWGPEYLITVHIFQSLLKIPSLKNSIVLEMKAEDVLEENSPGPTPRRLRKRCRCDIVLWSGAKRRRVIIEVKKYAQDCSYELGRILLLFKKNPKIEYAVLAACIQKEINGNKFTTRNSIIKDLNGFLKDMTEQAAEKGYSEVKLEPKNVEKNILPLNIVADDREVKDWVWRPVCFLIANNKER